MIGLLVALVWWGMMATAAGGLGILILGVLHALGHAPLED